MTLTMFVDENMPTIQSIDTTDHVHFAGDWHVYRFNNEFEIYNDFVAHERPEHESQQAVVDFLMARWRNSLSYAGKTHIRPHNLNTQH